MRTCEIQISITGEYKKTRLYSTFFNYLFFNYVVPPALLNSDKSTTENEAMQHVLFIVITAGCRLRCISSPALSPVILRQAAKSSQLNVNFADRASTAIRT